MKNFEYEDWLDDDGYPTDKALEKITNWDYKDTLGCFEFICSLWSYQNYYNTEKTTNDFDSPIVRIKLSTGGWSGNESIINALEKNHIIWMTSWFQSRRGGHYIFEVRVEK